MGGLLFLLSSCDAPTRETSENPELLPIPAYGATPLPDLQSGAIRSSAPGSTQPREPAAYQLLKNYANEHPEHPYTAIAGVWNAEKGRYDYQSLPLAFPDSVLKQAGGRYGYFQYRLSDAEGKKYRILAGLIPPGPRARFMMQWWLQFSDRSKVRINHSSIPERFANYGNSLQTSANLGDVQTGSDSYQTCVNLPPNGHKYCWLDEIVVDSGPKEPETYVPDDGWPGGGSGGYGDTGGGGTGSGGFGGGSCPTGCGVSGGGIPTGDNILSNYPEVKYLPGSNYAPKYPKFTEYLKNI